jgi:hypothetical protein
VRIEEQCRPVVATLDCADNVPGFVNRYPVEAEPFHFFADVRSHRLFMAQHAGDSHKFSSEFDKRLFLSTSHQIISITDCIEGAP